ncbi:Tash1-like protein, putative [Theileria annulata]|uniref:Tash1-like protein, putative n=1 Tax=Theileria annulata TaxID=5874 RepID=Q4UHF0_THEAN|nr:Tash1-like protein, putative [Theileria annulata]CAI73489.1 Tash1-like protein, putative [Theileria annulata]|eukprot:XP_954166.1 Tash1-like protein, putative [Theileria annulata]
MVRFNTLCIFYGLVIYYIRIVSSNVLDLNNLDNPKFYTMRIVEQGVTKIMILSTPENKITEIRRGRLLIWSLDPGEYVKCVTVFIFHWSGKVLINFEIENPRRTDMYYLHKYYSHFKYISKREFEEEYRTLLLIEKELESEIRKHKSIGETDLGFKPTKLRRLIGKIKHSEEPTKHTQPTELETTEPEDLDPETIHFEVSSDDEEEKPLDLSIKHKSKTTEAEQIETTESEEIDPETIKVEVGSDDEDTCEEELTKQERKDQLMDKLKKMIKQRIKEKSKHTQELDPETTEMELESDEEEKPLDLSTKQDRKQVMDKLKKMIKQRIKEKTKHTQELDPETTEPEDLETSEPEDLDPETIPVELESDEEELELPEPLDLSIKHKSKTIEPEEVETTEPEELDPETIPVDIESDEEDE